MRSSKKLRKTSLLSLFNVCPPKDTHTHTHFKKSLFIYFFSMNPLFALDFSPKQPSRNASVSWLVCLKSCFLKAKTFFFFFFCKFIFLQNCTNELVVINYRSQSFFSCGRSQYFLATAVQEKRPSFPEGPSYSGVSSKSRKTLTRSLARRAADAAGTLTPPHVNLFPIQREKKKRKCFSSSWQKVEADTFPWVSWQGKSVGLFVLKTAAPLLSCFLLSFASLIS